MPIIPDIYILHSGEASEQALACTLATDFGGLQASPVLMTADELIERNKDRRHLPVLGPLAGILPGTVIALLSEAMLKDPDRRVALLATVAGASLLDFRHYFICLGMTPEQARDRYPDLALIYENVMLRTESDLGSVIEDVKRNFSRRIPGSGWAREGLKLLLGTAVAIVLSQVSRVYTLRFLLAAALAVLLYKRASLTLTAVFLVPCFYVVGVGLSRINPLDLWPWLGRSWKWSASLDALHSPQVFLLGPIVFAGATAGGTAAIITGHRAPFVIGFASGLVVQMLIDAVLVFTGSRLLHEAKASHPTGLPSDETECDPGHLREAIRSGLALRTYNLTIVVGSLFVVSVVSVVGAARFPRPLGFMWLAAFSLGAFAPTIIAASWLAASASAMRVYGLTKTHLSRTSEAYQRVSNAGMPYPLGIDDANLAKLNDHEKEELMRFVFLQRIPVGLSLRGWFMSKDFAFVSYVWSDEQRLSIAERLDETLRNIGVRSFRDINAIQDPFTAWREYISSALMRCTHFFLVVSPGIRHGQVVHREIETVFQRWFLEMLPAVICVVDPKDARELCDDHQVPLQVRILLMCCPQMTISEARDPRLVRYIVEHTRRQGKWNDWLTMLSPSAARHRILRMPGIVRTREETGPRSEPPRGAANGRLG